MRFAAALLATALPLLANGQTQLLPAGEFASRDGRPGPGQTWKLDDADGRQLAEQLNAIARLSQISIDYEHQTLMAPKNGQPAPAAGWMTPNFVWRPGEGLFTQVDWTARAKGLIDADEYRYISPVILYDEQGRVRGLHNAALVSVPGLLGMDRVQAALSALSFDPEPTKGPFMDRKQLAAALGLKEDATDTQITERIAALSALEKAPPLPKAMTAALGLAEGADEAAALAALAKVKSSPDAASLAQMTELQGKVATLSAQILERDVTELVDGAIDAHKLMPAQRDWALSLGKTNMAQLKAFVDSAVAIPGLNGQSNGQDRGGESGEPDPAEVARQAQAYQTAQLSAGVQISTQQAVDHVMATGGK